jgi:hypothetical protein
MAESDRDLELLKQIKDTEQKQYHFFIVIALGVLSFSIERFDSQAAHSWLTFIQLSWMSLLISALAGIVQIQWRLAIDVTQRKMVAARRDLARYTDALNGRAGIIDPDTNAPLTRAQLQQSCDQYQSALRVGEMDFDKRSKQTNCTTQLQVYSLYLGLLLLALFKILNTH